MTHPFKLYRLQQLDSQIDRARAHLEEKKVALNDDQVLRQVEVQKKQADEVLQVARKSLNRAEEAVRHQRIKIEETEAALYSGKVRNPKELQDLQNEAAALKRYCNVLEDRQLEVMLMEEEALAADNMMAIELEKEAARYSARQMKLKEELGYLHKEIPNLEEERKAAASSIPSDLLTLYETLRIQRRGIAVVLVKNKTCSACGTTLNSALLDAARSSININRCDSCGRILYVG